MCIKGSYTRGDAERQWGEKRQNIDKNITCKTLTFYLNRYDYLQKTKLYGNLSYTPSVFNKKLK